MLVTSLKSAPRTILVRILAAFLTQSLALCLLVGCSGGEEGGDAMLAGEVSEQRPREFSEADKRAARVLSIGSSATIEAGGEYAQAMLCANGIAVLLERLRETGGLTGEQLRAVEQAGAFYDRQRRSLAGGERKSPDDIARDLEQAAADNSDVAVNARIAIGCLQRLQQPG